MTFITYPETKYDPKRHKVECEDRYQTPMGEVIRQTVSTCPDASPIVRNLTSYYRWTLNGEQVGWGKDYDDAAKQTLLKLLEPFGVKDKKTGRTK
jgi:hypothetical protein